MTFEDITRTIIEKERDWTGYKVKLKDGRTIACNSISIDTSDESFRSSLLHMRSYDFKPEDVEDISELDVHEIDNKLFSL